MNPLIEALVRTDTPGDVGDAGGVQAALEQIHARFVDERTHGYINPATGQHQPPVSPEEAEQRWQAVKPKFQQYLLKAGTQANDPVSQRLGLSRGALPASSDYREANLDYRDTGAVAPEGAGEPMDPAEYEQGWNEGPAERAMREEPGLRRGESKTRQMINKLLA